MKQNTTVLIVGAGPCGLASACLLLAQGIDVRVLEAAAEPPEGARAILLWPPTLEILRTIGILAQADELGFRSQALNYHLTGGKRIRVGLRPRNQPLMLQQDRTAALLEQALERLGGKVERGVRVTDVRTDDRTVEITAETAEGTQIMRGDWLIGADGVGSTVRRRLGIEFEGTPIPATFLLAEGDMQGDFDRDELHYVFGHSGALVFAPLPGGIVRIAAPISPDTPLTEQTVQRILDERGPGGWQMRVKGQVTSFTSQERIAAVLRRNRCFLVGDAAHTHSPVGGQGLNLGLQDVGNLIWKLTGVIDGQLTPAVLDSYDPERRYVAAEVLRLTGALTKLAVLGPIAARVRNVVWRLLEQSGALRHWYAPRLAGWHARYPEPYPGARVPPAALADSDFTSLRLVTTGGPNDALVAQARYLARTSSVRVRHEHMTGGRQQFYLVRPDGFLAASGRTVSDLPGVVEFLEKVGAQQ
ncbi:FAD-dependent oxidoreductase [Nocardia sp. NPDC059091]|uniref:FAD-dependent oxidoreductase n=1 Tax=unclassified Nocardia TaxID=2637762 RepID=UPI0036D0D273